MESPSIRCIIESDGCHAGLQNRAEREVLVAYRAASGTHSGEKGSQPLNDLLAEAGTMPLTEMRDSNVPARDRNARVLLRSPEQLPDRIEEVMIQSDSAGPSADVIRPSNRRELRLAALRRLGVIGFAVSAVRLQDLMATVANVPAVDRKPMRVLKNRPREAASRRLWKWTRKTTPSWR